MTKEEFYELEEGSVVGLQCSNNLYEIIHGESIVHPTIENSLIELIVCKNVVTGNMIVFSEDEAEHYGLYKKTLN